MLPGSPADFGALSVRFQSDSSTDAEGHEQDLRPRPARRKRRRPEDRGLPPDHQELRRLAEVYLRLARQLWPKLAESGLIPEPDDEVIDEMVEDFVRRHRGGAVDLQRLGRFRRRDLQLAAAYPRYSDDNSQPASITAQLRQILQKAKAEGRFVVWAYIYGDYAESALTSARRGYMSLIDLLQSAPHQVDTVYIDEFSRASRNDIDWMQLAGMCKEREIRLVGASDGFNLDMQDWKLMVQVHTIITTQETENKRRRVWRNMLDAAGENRVLGKLPLGYTRRILRDDSGRAVCRDDGRSRHERAIDPETAPLVRRMFDLAVNHGWSPHALAKKFNEDKSEDWNGWTPEAIRKMLINPAYIGLFVWNRQRRQPVQMSLDRANGDQHKSRYRIVLNPWRKWERFYDKKLALIPKAWHVAMRRKVEKQRKVRRTAKANGEASVPADRRPVTLFSSTLVCGYCGGEITLWKSGKWPCMFCRNGNEARHGCKLSSSKSTKIIEQSLLDYIRERLVTEDTLADLFTRANAYLAEEAARPREDLAPLKKQIRRIETSLDRLVRLTEQEDEETLGNRFVQRIKQLEAERRAACAELREKERHHAVPPPALTLAHVEQYVADMRAVLNQEPSASALVLRKLTGPITITHEPNSNGKRGYRWVATFSPDLLALLRELTGEDCPETIILEFLSDRKWTVSQSVQVTLEKVYAYERHADAVRAMVDKGARVATVATAFGVAWPEANQWVKYATTGQRPTWTKGRKTGKGRSPATYKTIAAEVARLRDQQQMSLKQIAHKLGVHGNTVRRAYDHAHPDTARQAAVQGRTPPRGRYSHLGAKVKNKIRDMLKQGHRTVEIAARLGCGASTVGRIRKEIQQGD